MSSSLLRLRALLAWVLAFSASGVLAADAPAPDAFEAYLRPAYPPADGFTSMPDVSAARPGSEVRALAHGQVVEVGVGQHSVVVEHLYYENHALLRARSEYAGLDSVQVRAGARVTRGQVLGRVGQKARLAVALHAGKTLSAVEARRFTASREKLPVPSQEPALLLISHADFQLRLYTRGREQVRMEVGFGQAAGAKQVRGDNRTPKGMYFITQKLRGDIPGPYSAYYGGHWMRVNYPNPWDADRGVSGGFVDAKTRERIARDWAARKTTDASTRLGSGIGLHGWAGEWSLEDSGGRLSWGCVVMHTPDIAALYDRVPEGTMVVLF
ncbi:L,D-transpeptidase family protein [Pyxidicoccus xibeiensis]|uniref:L,D-transpeptidase family protein n=1 Tax=Pyxidicoccus xibeiensis TaxID=2906759 RepID=UPI0020A747D4|nr:L,D-transpeptidase family protein [Pyxidicoccus xibeiensis]MCP3142641.1 L,D-transpeptidase family protein [Pyxidicoccus xibeiensis]